MKVSLPSILQY